MRLEQVEQRCHTPRARTKGAIVGAGAQGRVTAAVWRRAYPNATIAFVDDNAAAWNTVVDGIQVVGGPQLFDETANGFDAAIVALGSNPTRVQVAARLQGRAPFGNVIDPSAVLMPGSQLGVGIFVGPNAVIHTGAIVEDHALINTGAIVEHDCSVGHGATVAPGVRMAGRVHIGAGAFLGTGASVVGRVRIGAGAIVGAGAVVTRDVPAGCVTFGVPAKVVRLVRPEDWSKLL